MRPGHSTPSSDAQPDRTSLLAWAGWQLEVPDDWRPLKLSGTPAKGSMLVGDAQCAMFSIHWERPRAGALLNGNQWVEGRLKKLGSQPQSRPPAAEHFSACAWTRGLQTEEDKQTTHWYGYSAPAELMLGLKVNGVLPESLLGRLIRQVLPSLRTSPAFAPSTWAMYDLSFTAPPGFQLVSRHLFTGDVALLFQKGRNQTLMLRQVYPGDLALSRRSFADWLKAYPFKQHRKLKKSGIKIEPWVDERLPDVSGVRRLAVKRLGFPLWALAARQSAAVAAHDEQFNRLLIAEHMARRDADLSICQSAVRAMNRWRGEGA